MAVIDSSLQAAALPTGTHAPTELPQQHILIRAIVQCLTSYDVHP